MTSRIDPKEVNFGGWLDAQLQKRGWNRTEFARRNDLYPSIVHKWGNNQYRPRPEQCRIIAAGLGVSNEEVYEAAGQVPREGDVSLIQNEIRQLAARIPDELLIPFVSAFRALADKTEQEEALRRVRHYVERQRRAKHDGKHDGKHGDNGPPGPETEDAGPLQVPNRDGHVRTKSPKSQKWETRSGVKSH